MSLLDTWITKHLIHSHTLFVQAPVLEEMLQVRLAEISAHFVLTMEEYKLVSHMGYEQVSID